MGEWERRCVRLQLATIRVYEFTVSRTLRSFLEYYKLNVVELDAARECTWHIVPGIEQKVINISTSDDRRTNDRRSAQFILFVL